MRHFTQGRFRRRDAPLPWAIAASPMGLVDDSAHDAEVSQSSA
jgi:hypothetical protein